jgi:predicted Zn-dependent protease
MSMKSTPRSGLPIIVAALAIVGLAGCESLGELSIPGLDGLEVSGPLDQEETARIQEGVQGVERSFDDFTPEQEYYIGRSVGAVILDQYELYENEAANDYLNTLGQALSLASDRPVLFVGYRFQILDSDEINAFATPSGLVLISRGMLRLTRDEAEVASILAHEIAHVVARHGLQSIRASRITGSITGLLGTTAEVLSPSEVSNLTEAFTGSIDDVTNTLVTSGYSRATEREADSMAVEILKRIGYDPNALIRVLQRMDDELEPGGLDFAKTHPDPEVRIDVVRRAIGDFEYEGSLPEPARLRFEQALRDV